MGHLQISGKKFITVQAFDEHTAVSPGIVQESNNGRGVNTKGSVGVISNGSKIFIPENTAAFIFSQSGIEENYYRTRWICNTKMVKQYFYGDGLKKSLFDNVVNRVGFGGQSDQQKQICFVNLREIRDIKFGTRGPVMYNDFVLWGQILEVRAFGTFSIQITDAKQFISKLSSCQCDLLYL